MNFDLTPDERLLMETAASFVKKEAPLSRLRPLREDPIGWSKDVWKKMGELGWLGIVFPESIGGFGGNFLSAAILLEEMGAGLVVEPFVPSVILAGTAILRAGNAEQQKRWLEPVIAGDTSLALAHAEARSRFSTSYVATKAEDKGGKYRITGKKTFALNGHAADAIVVSARMSGAVDSPDGISLFVIDPKERGVQITNVPAMDGHRAAHVTLEAVEVEKDRMLGPAGKAGAALEEALDLGAAAACAEAVGVMRATLFMTLEYLRTREQFGRKIGSFQALQHRAVDMFVESELAKSITMQSSIRASEGGDERRRAISAAKSHVAVSGRYVTQQAIQLHGGIGVTDEHDVGLYFKRMHVLGTIFGDEDFHVRRFGELPSFVAHVD